VQPVARFPDPVQPVAASREAYRVGLWRPLDGGLRFCNGYVGWASARRLVGESGLDRSLLADRTSTGYGLEEGAQHLDRSA
jgi:hypothetical protein